MTDVVRGTDFLFRAADRHDGYARLRDAGPIHRITGPSGKPGWLVTGYDAVREALADPRLSKGGPLRVMSYGDHLPEDVRLGMNSHMLNSDPPDHTRLRRLVSAAFTRRRMEQLRPRVQDITDELLDAMAGRDEVDLVEALALPLPIRVIGELLGVPDEDYAAFHDWSTTLTAGALALDRLDGAATHMVAYIRQLLARKRREPGADLLSALIAVRDGADRLSEHELTSMVFLLLVAGHETTVNLIANGALVLLRDPGRAARLRAAPDLLPAAVEELLRYESPVHVATMRLASEPLELAGETIEAGSFVVLSLLAANRDQDRFADPDAVDLARPENPHIAFGHGIHYCLGAPLARLEGVVAIGSLLARFPDLRLAGPVGDLPWRASLLMHGLSALPVRLRQVAAPGSADREAV